MNLRARLLLLVATATIVPAILLGVRFFQDRAATIEMALVTLSTQANNIATDLDEKILGTAQLHFGLARAVDLDTTDRAKCSRFLSSVREQYPQYTGVVTLTPEGRMFCDSLETNRDLLLSDRQYFQDALVTTDAVTLEPVIGRLTGASVLQIAYPARRASGQLKFILLASFNLQKFIDAHSQRLPSGLDMLIVDKAGEVLATPAGSVWQRRIRASLADTDMFRLAAGKTRDRAREVTGLDGSKQFWAAVDSSTARDAGLYVMVGTSNKFLVAPANRRLYGELAVLTALSCLLFAGVWALAEVGIRRQVSRIAAMAKKISTGDMSTRIAAPFPSGELGGLMIEMNAAADSLQRQHGAIAQLNLELRHSKHEEAMAKVFLHTVIEHIPNPISVKVPPPDNRDGWQITLVNRAYEQLAGRPREMLIGRSAREIYQSKTADDIVTADQAALATGSTVVEGELSLLTIQDRPRLVASKRVAIRDGDGMPQYLLTVLEDITEKRESEGRIAYMAHHDALTDLPNRAAFNICIADTIAKAAANKDSFAILSIDLARFKETNDVYGHATGDALLQEVAHRLQTAAGETFIARIGGDEFILIVTGGPQPETAAELAHRLLAAFADDFAIEDKQIQIGLGIGGAVYPVDGTDAKTLMVNADAALYRAKAAPHTSLLFFEPEMGVELQLRHNLQHDLRHAVCRGEMLLHYQPQYRIEGTLIGFEALARWQSPVHGMVPPGTFIPIAEEYSLILPLGEWALREACREAATWAKPLGVAVNVSPIQFHHGDLPKLVHSILLETGLAPGRLALEITEGVLINDFSRAVSILRRLKALGVQIALDDFGKGYSSLSYLHSFAFDKIKVDRAFIDDLEHNHHSIAIVRAVIGIGHSLNIPVLAEGVENEGQRILLLAEGCDEVQGYLTGRPYPISHYADAVSGVTAAPSKRTRAAGSHAS